MSSAGQQLIAGRIPGELIDEVSVTADSSLFTTTETTVMTLTVSLVSGRTYRLVATPGWGSSVDADVVVGHIREDNDTGNRLHRSYVAIENGNTASRNFMTPLEGRYTASATGSKTFVVTGQRAIGTGNLGLKANSFNPSILSCYYHEG